MLDRSAHHASVPRRPLDVTTDLAGLDLGATTHTAAGTYAADAWTFTPTDTNYNGDSGTVDDAINRAHPACTVTRYPLTSHGTAHTATGACTALDGTTDLAG